mmetsp:Transcript_67411/g.160844  ORF Transcript_67411/g.160844 Transcript_67411/m.160844 type:complete len:206 (+) Transcript_67411:3976-4593(+)
MGSSALPLDAHRLGLARAVRKPLDHHPGLGGSGAPRRGPRAGLTPPLPLHHRGGGPGRGAGRDRTISSDGRLHGRGNARGLPPCGILVGRVPLLRGQDRLPRRRFLLQPGDSCRGGGVDRTFRVLAAGRGPALSHHLRCPGCQPRPELLDGGHQRRLRVIRRGLVERGSTHPHAHGVPGRHGGATARDRNPGGGCDPAADSGPGG